jgi:outer membrane receptor for ferrienterochelin and colicins
MKTRFKFLILIVFFPLAILAQKPNLDSIQKLEEVVVTGQYSKQSVKKSVYEVKVISNEVIKQNAANNLADLLNQNLNIQIIPAAHVGKSQVSLFGLDGQYFKVLMDGIPMVSDEGFGNNIDLTQINLDDIEQIEIVEGAMGVDYGANAVTGIINLITKKSTRNKVDFNFSVQEETIDKEYEWWAKGRHIQTLSISSNISPKLYSSFNFSRNDFAGYFNDKQGKNYIYDDGNRGYEWLPKEQMTGNASLHFKVNNLTAFYKFGMFREMLNEYNRHVTTIYNTETQQLDKTARDTDHRTLRFSHNLNLNGRSSKNLIYDFSVAFQTQNRDTRDYIYDLYTRNADYFEYEDFLNRTTFYAKSTVSNFIQNSKINFQLGAEFDYESGFISATSTDYSFIDASNKMHYFDLFVTSEYKPFEKLATKLGYRYSFQSSFNNQQAYILSTKYQIGDKVELRNVIGSAYRTPNYEELFTYFVDNTHNVQGNPNLKTENGFSVFTHLKIDVFDKTNSKMTSQLTFGYLDLKNKIDLAIVKIDPLEYLYINIDRSKSLEFSLDNKIKVNNFDVKIGLSLLGVSDQIGTATQINNEYLYKLNGSLSAYYTFDKHDLSLALTHKFSGKDYEYIEDEDDGENVVYTKVETESYHWTDFSVKKYFLNHSLETTFGIRNIFDVTQLKRTGFGLGGETHGNLADGLMLGYGRSYFVKLSYNLDIK